jgi:hypothetical protein
MFQSRKFYLSLVGVVAWSSTAAETILSILESASLSTRQSLLLHIASASSALDAVSLCCIAFYTIQGVRQIGKTNHRSGQVRALVGLSICLSAVALVFSLVQIIVIKSRWDEVIRTPSTSPVSNWDGLVVAQIALWAVSCLSQIVLYSSVLWQRQTPEAQVVAISGPRDSVMSDIRLSQPSRNFYSMEPTQPSSRLAAGLASPTFSNRSSHSLQSFRDSLRQVVRPATSRTTLISRPSFNRETGSIYSHAESVDNVSHSDGFDSWDTSSVSLQARDAVMQTAPSKGTVLDPIPGSRPTTPARVLEGPFLTELREEEEELTPPRPKMMRDDARPPSPAVSEAHIHPLFRTESPVPPPEATPDTSIFASPLANQAIACTPRAFNRMRSNSQLKTAQSVNERATSPQSTSRRSLSPPSRELTPPIPDYVLSSSPRSSCSGSRKVQLQYSPDR